MKTSPRYKRVKSFAGGEETWEAMEYAQGHSLWEPMKKSVRKRKHVVEGLSSQASGCTRAYAHTTLAVPRPSGWTTREGISPTPSCTPSCTPSPRPKSTPSPICNSTKPNAITPTMLSFLLAVTLGFWNNQHDRDLMPNSISLTAFCCAALQHSQTGTECCLEFAQRLSFICFGRLSIVSWAGLGQRIPHRTRLFTGCPHLHYVPLQQLPMQVMICPSPHPVLSLLPSRSGSPSSFNQGGGGFSKIGHPDLKKETPEPKFKKGGFQGGGGGGGLRGVFAARGYRAREGTPAPLAPLADPKWTR